MSESGDYEPAPHWGGYDYATARRAYKDNIIDRGASKAISAGVDASSLVPESLETNCEAPLIIACDVTGSMGEWPGVIFSKLPYLEYEGKEYLGEDMQISFAAVGDCHGDKYPLQVQPFVDGIALKTSLEKLIIEGGGGGTSEESYDLAALYYARNCNCPKAIHKPIMIIIGDEGVYSYIEKTAAKDFCKVDTDKKLTPSVVFDELKEKFAVYVVRKPYGTNTNERTDPRETRIQQQWVDLLGADHVVSLPDANRVVDVIFGILAKETDRIEYFKKELEDRQGKDKDGDKKIEVVLKSLHTVHSLSSPVSKKKITDGRSVSVSKNKGGKSKKSSSLLD